MPAATSPGYSPNPSTRTTYSNFCFHNLVVSATSVAEFFFTPTKHHMEQPQPIPPATDTLQSTSRHDNSNPQPTRKTIEVVAAIIRRDKQILATQRGYGKWEGWWEFPGGKIEPGESRQQALVRELREELDTEIVIEKPLTTIDYDYPDFHLTMHCFLCRLGRGGITLKEHHAARWLDAHSLHTVQWLPADQDIIDLLTRMLTDTGTTHQNE